MSPLLTVEDLAVEFRTEDGVARALDGVSFTVEAGETVAIVGESGSGKSVTALTVLGLLRRPPARIVRGSVRFRDRELLRLSRDELRKIRGKDAAMVFQDPMTALNPVQRVGKQIAEAIRLHSAVSRQQAMARAVDLLGLVGMAQPGTRARQYPHEFSGGMRQRAMIAMAIANDPALLIADEPTTALDVTIQAQVLSLLRTAKQETGAATVLITHDLGVVAEMAERVLVMYAGRIVEQADVRSLFASPRHPYTAGLLASIPRLDVESQTLTPIPGSPPSLLAPPPGCPFAPRCALRQGRAECVSERPALREVDGHATACHFAELAE
ncbi:ABC transporter ATP-binding protein [Actinophytocola algeriensis]|uniref:Oligopeptide/dipeptide ABC transporter ATP-binding protein n=1 Tax=Actinophytocola algeriensis TaxID=1768010 RepID=A0A7W7VF36_9PSEU|nr:ABC transporter ATP-binding protein [Actinophytocola algeriensis]MBB4907906.1 oligopeptide/dipeptide ABC transporter ATP-binding protein [Actinophytocola algeriensis]MBE1479936.1 oligopeptide/dipeptide ABC transporter ATP-binding protein [Actinophytocola algeriensis]